jgi:S-adenosylmethionine uptake transporter
VGWRRLLAVAVGFIGVLLIIRPSFEAVGPAALLPLAAAVSYAGYLSITRHVAGTEHPRVMQLWVSVSGALVLGGVIALASPFSWPVLAPSWPTALELLLLLAMGAIATTSHMLAIHAIRIAPAQILAPFQYTEILGATIMGVLFFGNWPDRQTMIGIAIIVGSGLYVFFRERQLARRGASRT